MFALELVRILPQVVQLAVAVRVLGVLVVERADSVEVTGSRGVVDKEVAAVLLDAIAPERQQRDAVLSATGPDACGVEDRLGVVHVHRELAAVNAAWQRLVPRPA